MHSLQSAGTDSPNGHPRCFKMCSALGDTTKFDKLSPTQLVEAAARIVPELSWTASKGGAGRVAVIGGSVEYTGAPFFAAVTSLSKPFLPQISHCQQSWSAEHTSIVIL
eukprot:984714-Rhodomonas_salina.2